MHLSKNVQYGVTAALAVYIVFFTRPAPLPLVNLLSNPLAQLAVLGAVVYIGAKVSLLVALVAAVAVVLTIPAREFFGAKKKDKKEKMDTKKSLESALEIPMVSKALSAVDKKVDEKRRNGEPTPAADMVEAKGDAKGSENFSLQSAADF
jgi:hypothetical protein